MAEVVYNACYGGFGLSDEAVELYLTKKGLEFSVKDSRYSLTGKTYYVNGEYFYAGDLDRADPVLVEVVKELGTKANGEFSDLEIAEVASGDLYRIDEYDGYEAVMTTDDYEWKTA